MSDTTMIPPGYYPGVATPVEGDDGAPLVRFALAGEKATKQVLVYFKVTEGPFAGTVLPWFGFFTNDSWRRTIESLRYIGFKGNDLATINEQELDQKVSLKVEHNEYDGKVYPRVAFVNKPGAGAIKLKNPMSKDQSRQFAAMMKQYLGQVPEVQGERATDERQTDNAFGPSTGAGGADPFGGSPPASSADPMDDIPF